MIGVNLIPKHRAELSMARARRRLWLISGGMYATVVLFVGVLVQLAPIGDLAAMETRLDGLTRNLDSQRLRLRGTRTSLDKALTRLHANRSIGEQPDFSILLGLLSEAKGNDIALRSCAFGSERGAGQVELVPNAVERAQLQDFPTLKLNIEGLGRDPGAVSDFVLRLENLPLFRQVRQTETWREPFFNQEAFGFRLECLLATAEEPRP